MQTKRWQNVHRNRNFGLGHCYRYGIGVDQDWDRAKEFYQAAATAGHPLAKQAIEELEKN